VLTRGFDRRHAEYTMDRSLDELWAASPAVDFRFEPHVVADLPDAAQRYLEHAIAPDTRLASAVRLRMHGQIKLSRWLPFKAEQVIARSRGMIWRATVRLYGLPISGFDRLVDGEGSMQWKLLGLVPVMRASGANVTRSAAGRVAAESVWLPSALCGVDVSWRATGSSRAQATLPVHDEEMTLDLTVDQRGALESVHLQRWGNPGGGDFRKISFGGIVEEEGTFGGYTIPTRLRIGWHFEAGSFGCDGEFFRVIVDDAAYR
jgi:hypothetical protein